MKITAVLVCHDGERWLPQVLEGLRSSTRRPDRVIAVDTGSRDGTAELVAAEFGADAVVTTGSRTGFPQAVARALESAAPESDEWIWLLHDDAVVAPDTLERLVEAAQAHPEASILGPKLREWPSLKRLVEMGVTISGTGRRETGLEPGEYDQGQHDTVRRVLAVNTAGMLVRRDVYDALGGLDPALPFFGNDLDFGWRAARAGHTTLVIPQAVMFHAEAARRGQRTSRAVGRPHRREREAALYTLLVNGRGATLPFRAIRLFFGSLLRILGLLLVRAPGEAYDEFGALAYVFTRPGRIVAGRRARRDLSGGDPDEVAGLLAPWWLPYRHGVDLVSDVGSAASMQAQDVAERRRAAKTREQVAREGTLRSDEEAEDELLGEDQGFLARYLTNPVALVMTLFVLALVWGMRQAFDAGHLSGGALSPVPEGSGAWWRMHLLDTHALGAGTDAPGPAYLPVLAGLGIPLLGSAGAVMTVLWCGSVLAATWGAWRLLRVLGHAIDPRGAHRWMLAWGAASYGLVPLVSGAWGQGRFGAVATAALLPWIAHCVLGMADPDPERRWRAGWRTGLLVALAAAFTPLVWVVAVFLVAVLLAAAFGIARTAMRTASAWGPPLVAVLVPPVLLAPWFGPLVLRGEFAALLVDAGRLPVSDIGGWQLAAGRLGEAGTAAPLWIGLVLAAGAVLALLSVRSRIPVLICWIAALTAALVALGLTRLRVELPGARTPVSVDFLVLLLQGAAICAVAMGATGLLRAGGWQRIVGLVLGAAMALVPLAGTVWLLVDAETELSGTDPSVVPAYMSQASEADRTQGVLVLTGDVRDGVDYQILRGPGMRLGEDEIARLTPEDPQVTAAVAGLLAKPDPAALRRLGRAGVEYVVAPAPVDGQVSSVLDATTGLTQASAKDGSSRAWQVDGEPTGDATETAGESRSLGRTLWVVLQLIAVVVVLVLCAPSRRSRR